MNFLQIAQLGKNQSLSQGQRPGMVLRLPAHQDQASLQVHFLSLTKSAEVEANWRERGLGTGSAVWSLATRRIFYKEKLYAMEAMLLSENLRITRIYRGKVAVRDI